MFESLKVRPKKVDPRGFYKSFGSKFYEKHQHQPFDPLNAYCNLLLDNMPGSGTTHAGTDVLSGG